MSGTKVFQAVCSGLKVIVLFEVYKLLIKFLFLQNAPEVLTAFMAYASLPIKRSFGETMRR
ncbi:MAG: hypothetical protein ABI686_14230, partial [Acidobacteriota bacterium]